MHMLMNVKASIAHCSLMTFEANDFGKIVLSRKSFLQDIYRALMSMDEYLSQCMHNIRMQFFRSQIQTSSLCDLGPWYTYVCTHMCVCVCIYVPFMRRKPALLVTSICTCMQTHRSMCVCVDVSICVCVCKYMYWLETMCTTRCEL